MSNFFNFIGLRKNLRIDLKYGKGDFIELMKTEINPGQLFFLDLFDDNQKKYYGEIDQNSFAVRRSQKIQPKSLFSKATGRITGGPHNTTLDISIKGYNWFSLIF